MVKISNVISYARLNEYEKEMYKAGFIWIDGSLTADGMDIILSFLADKHKEELAELAKKKIAEEAK